MFGSAVMLTIRRLQMAAFEEDASARLEAELVAFVRDTAPRSTVAAADRAAFVARVRLRAAGFGLIAPELVRSLLALLIAHGERLLDQPWVQAALRDPGRTGRQRLAAVEQGLAGEGADVGGHAAP